MDQFNFNNFPETNFNEVNLSWMLEVMTRFKEDLESGQFVGPPGPQGPQGEPGPAGDGITEEVKQALLQLARKVAYIDNQGQAYYQDLYNALYGVTPTELVSISAAFNQGSAVIYESDSLDTLKQYLVVTATYSDSSTSVIPSSDYTLSGTLVVGTSTITVSYRGKTTTFQVTVTASTITLVSISAVFNQGGAVIYESDSLDSLKQYLVVTATYSDSSTSVIPSSDYTLSGTLATGTSTITVSYSGKITTFNVTVSEESQYVMDDLELWLDARKYKNLTDYRKITDQSGNNVTLTFNGTSASQVHFYDKFVNVGARGSIKVDSAAFVALLASGWTIETTFQNRYYNADNGTSTPTNAGNNRMASFVNGRAIINSDSRVQLLTNNTYYGTARDLTDGVNTISVTYNGTTLTEYLNGVEIYSASASIDMTTPTFFELFGNAGYAANAQCSWNAARVYSKVLTAAEIKDNYDLDVVNYGTVNIAEAPAGA